jgi:UDP-N-acetylmuramate--alanine ligase
MNSDDPGLGGIKTSKAVTFSCSSPADMRAEDIRLSPLGSAFRVQGAEIRLRMPGLHNVINALATLSALSVYGAGPEKAADALYAFEGLQRRFDVHLNELDSGGVLVVDDYAHNPHKISFMMNTMRNISKRVCYVFQPHGFGPLRMMFDEYADVFSGLLRPEDSLMLLPVFYAGGTADHSVNSADLAREIKGRASAPESREQVLELLDPSHGAFVVFGARDDTLSGLASDIAQRLRGVKIR